MLRHLNCFGLSALLLTTLAGPARALDPVTDSEKIDAVYKQLREQLPKQELRLTLTEVEMRDLKKRIEDLGTRLRSREEADRIARAYTPPIIAAYPPPVIAAYPPPVIARSFTPSSSSGMIRLDNRSSWRSTIIFDGVAYDLPPFQSITLPPRSAGPVSYDIFADGWGRIRSTTATLQPDRPFTVFVYDR